MTTASAALAPSKPRTSLRAFLSRWWSRNVAAMDPQPVASWLDAA